MLVAVAETFVGAPSGPGATGLEAIDAGLVASAFIAVTVNVYAVPFVRPVTVAVSAPLDQLAVLPSGLAVMA